jgi:hypothetical protein
VLQCNTVPLSMSSVESSLTRLWNKSRFVIGTTILICLVPLVAVVVGTSVLWDFILKKTLKTRYDNNFWMSEKPEWLRKFNQQVAY